VRPAAKLAILLIGIAIMIAVYRVAKNRVHLTVGTSTASNSVLSVGSGNLLVDGDWSYYQKNDAQGSRVALSPGSVGLPSGSKAVRIPIDKAPQKMIDLGYRYPFKDVSFTKGEKVTLRFKARGSARNPIVVRFQSDIPPRYPACFSQSITLTPSWQDYSFTFATLEYAPREAEIVFKLGQTAGNIDLADLTLIRGRSMAQHESASTTR